jgi:uncharacterized protein (DUF427 family)
MGRLEPLRSLSTGVKAIWKGAVLAESGNTVVVEGNHYFPASVLESAYIEPSDHTSFCGWKGTASYYDVIVDGERNQNAVWYYLEPMAGAEEVRDRVAFWNGVQVVD